MKHVGMIQKISAAVAGVMFFSFLSCGPVHAKDLQVLKVSYLSIADVLQLFVGWEKGFFEEEGLKVEGQAVPSGAVSQTLVESGSADVGYTAVVPLAMAYSKGFNFAYIAPGDFIDKTNYKGMAILVKKDSPYNSLKDLAGKKIATNALNNLNHLNMLTFADFYGVDTKGLKFVEVPMPMMAAALKEGAVDAAVPVDPFVTISLSEGTTRVIQYGFFPQQIAPRCLAGGWFVKRANLEKNKDKIARFIKAINKSTEWISKNPDQSLPIIAKYTKLDPDLLRKMSRPKFVTKIYKKDIQTQIDLCAKFGFIPKGFDAREIVATEWFPIE